MTNFAERLIAPPRLSVYPLINFKFLNVDCAPPDVILNITVLFFPSKVACDDEVKVNFFDKEIVSPPVEMKFPLNFIVSPLLALFITF